MILNNNNISLQQISDLASPEFSRAMELYNELFPPEERKSIAQIKSLISNGIYRLDVLKDNSLNQIIGFDLVMSNKNPAFLLIDNIAIDNKFQGSGYGSDSVNLIVQTQSENSLGVFIEVELPSLAIDEEDRIIRKKRLDFYRRLNFITLKGIEYKFPVQEDEPLPLLLMFKPSEGTNSLSSEIIKNMIKSIFNNIHYEVNNRKEIFQSFVHTIKDQKF